MMKKSIIVSLLIVSTPLYGGFERAWIEANGNEVTSPEEFVTYVGKFRYTNDKKEEENQVTAGYTWLGWHAIADQNGEGVPSDEAILYFKIKTKGHGTGPNIPEDNHFNQLPVEADITCKITIRGQTKSPSCKVTVKTAKPGHV